MISNMPKSYFVIRDRNEWAAGEPEAIIIVRLPDVVGGIDLEKSVELEHVGDANMDDKSASIAYSGSGGFNGKKVTLTFLWKGNAEESHVFGDLMAGRYTNNSAGGTRKFMVMSAIEEAEVETLLAVDALDFFDCTKFQTKEDKITATVEFQGRDPLSKED